MSIGPGMPRSNPGHSTPRPPPVHGLGFSREFWKVWEFPPGNSAELELSAAFGGKSLKSTEFRWEMGMEQQNLLGLGRAEGISSPGPAGMIQSR